MKWVLATLVAFTLATSAFAATKEGDTKFRDLSAEQKKEKIENFMHKSPEERKAIIDKLKESHPEAAQRLEHLQSEKR
jgi:hypothetical protein